MALFKRFAGAGALALVLAAPVWAEDALKDAARAYRADRDVLALITLSQAILPGMTEAEVTALLGPLTYAPVVGLAFYATEAYDRVDNRDVPLALVIDYRDETGKVTGRVTSAEWMRIGE